MKKIIIFILVIFILAKNFNLPKSIFFSSHSWVFYRDKNVELQNFDYSCGSASLATILHYFYNINVNEKDILKYFLKNKKNDEVSFLDLSNIAEKFGFRAIGVKINNINVLKKLKIPAIIYLNLGSFKHFSVLKKMKNYKIYLADPTFGNVILPIDYFEKIFFAKEGFLLIILPKNRKLIKNANLDFLKTSYIKINKNLIEMKFNNLFLFKNKWH